MGFWWSGKRKVLRRNAVHGLSQFCSSGEILGM